MPLLFVITSSPWCRSVPSQHLPWPSCLGGFGTRFHHPQPAQTTHGAHEQPSTLLVHCGFKTKFPARPAFLPKHAPALPRLSAVGACPAGTWRDGTACRACPTGCSSCASGATNYLGFGTACNSCTPPFTLKQTTCGECVGDASAGVFGSLWACQIQPRLGHAAPTNQS